MPSLARRCLEMARDVAGGDDDVLTVWKGFASTFFLIHFSFFSLVTHGRSMAVRCITLNIGLYR